MAGDEKIYCPVHVIVIVIVSVHLNFSLWSYISVSLHLMTGRHLNSSSGGWADGRQLANSLDL